ncbi:MAG: ribosome biogenesis GTPase YqeH [Acholeplasmatales bacterium]|nr:ribosome biogenesis GTPase YqeH [Acholeplasmatales bacterium]
MILKKCKGCGAILQDQDENSQGFIPELNKDSVYCKRCYRMMHYNELPKIVASNKDYENVIDNVIKKNGLIVFVVDIFQFKATFNKKMIDKLKNKNVLLVANKYDCFPHSIKVESIVDWLSKECQKISFKVDAISVVSSKKGYYIDDLTNLIDMLRRERDVYFLGCANVGKSSLINALIKKNTSIKDDLISTSIIPGTTLNEIRIPFFDNNKAFIDTPGLINENDIFSKILSKSYDKLLPKNEIKPLTYQILAGNTIYLGGLASISFSDCDKLSVIVYSSNNLYIHRGKTEKREELYSTQLGKLLTPPTIDEVPNLKYFIENYKLDGQKKKTVWFSGFGFVEIKGKCNIEIKRIENTEVYITNAII